MTDYEKARDKNFSIVGQGGKPTGRTIALRQGVEWAKPMAMVLVQAIERYEWHYNQFQNLQVSQTSRELDKAHQNLIETPTNLRKKLGGGE